MSNASLKSLVPVWNGSDAKDPTLPAILEFQWPSTAIINAPVPRSARGIVWMITSMVIVLIAATGLIPIDRVVTAQGGGGFANADHSGAASGYGHRALDRCPGGTARYGPARC